MPIVEADFGLQVEHYLEAGLFQPSENLDALFPMILHRVPNCPYDLVRDALRGAAQEFCRKSLAWKVMLPAIPIVDGVANYALEIGPLAELVTIERIFAPCGQLHPITPGLLPAYLPDWQTATGTPRWYNSPDHRTVNVYPTPANTVPGASIRALAVLAPSMLAEDLDPLLTQRHGEAIITGALADLWATPDESWARPTLVAGATSSFLAAIDAAKIAAFHERVSGDLTVRPIRFGYR